MSKIVYLCLLALLSTENIFGLDLSSSYRVTWKSTPDRITFHIEAAAKGWVGLGFNSKGQMDGADMVVAGIDPNGNEYIYDMTGQDGAAPKLDTSQGEYKLVEAKENDTHTSLKISRSLTAKDQIEDVAIDNEPLYMLWAYNEKTDAALKPSANSNGRPQFPKHTLRGAQKQENLLQSE